MFILFYNVAVLGARKILIEKSEEKRIKQIFSEMILSLETVDHRSFFKFWELNQGPHTLGERFATRLQSQLHITSLQTPQIIGISAVTGYKISMSTNQYVFLYTGSSY